MVPNSGRKPALLLVHGAFETAQVFGRPVDVVRCETVDLEVPATAEIVVEGFLSHRETVEEGPMGEYAGYLWPGPGMQRPVYHVTAITHRHEPILPIVVAGEPVEEDHTAQGIPSAAELLVELREAGLPVTLAWVTLESANHWLVVTVPQAWRSLSGLDAPTLCRRIGTHVFERSKFGAVIPKIIVVNDDIDATNTKEVVWAFATRCHPVAGDPFRSRGDLSARRLPRAIGEARRPHPQGRLQLPAAGGLGGQAPEAHLLRAQLPRRPAGARPLALVGIWLQVLNLAPNRLVARCRGKRKRRCRVSLRRSLIGRGSLRPRDTAGSSDVER